MEMMTVISRPFAHLHICTWVLHRNAQQQPQHCNDLLDDVLHCSSSDDCHLQRLPSPGTTITLHEHCHLLDIQIFIVIQIGYRGYILERRNSKVFGSFLFMTYFPFDLSFQDQFEPGVGERLITWAENPENAATLQQQLSCCISSPERSCPTSSCSPMSSSDASCLTAIPSCFEVLSSRYRNLLINILGDSYP